MSAPLQIVLLGHGKTGGLVEEVAHASAAITIRIISADDNPGRQWHHQSIHAQRRRRYRFHHTLAVIPNITACAMAGK